MRQHAILLLPLLTSLTLTAANGQPRSSENASTATRPSDGFTSEAVLQQHDREIRRLINDGKMEEALQQIAVARALLGRSSERIAPAQADRTAVTLDVLERMAAARIRQQQDRRVVEQRQRRLEDQRDRLLQTTAARSDAEPGELVEEREIGPRAPVPRVQRWAAPRHREIDLPVVTYPDAATWRRISQRRPVGATPAIESRGYAQLAAVEQEIELPEGTGFGEAVNGLRERLNIDVNWNALALAGIDRNTPVQELRLKNVQLGTVLDLVLDHVGSAAGVELGYAVIDGVVRISTLEDLARLSKLRVYVVGDLLLRVRSFRAPTDVFSGGDSGFGSGFGGNTGGGLQGLTGTR